MKFDVNKFSLSVALTAVVFYLVVWLLHFSGMEWCSYYGADKMMMSGISTFWGFTLTVVNVFVCFYLLAALFAYTYNKLLERK